MPSKTLQDIRVLLLVCCISITCDNTLNPQNKSAEYGYLVLNLEFADHQAAKKAAIEERTVYARIYAYDRRGSILADESLMLSGTTARGRLKLVAQKDITIRVIGFDRLFTVNYMGNVDNITITPKAAVYVNIAMRKYGMVYIPGGTLLTSNGTEETIKPFYMAATEVTQVQWTRALPYVPMTNPITQVTTYLNDNKSRFNFDSGRPMERVTRPAQTA